MIVPTHEVKNSIAIEINPKDDDGQYFFSTDNQTTQFNIDPATYADDSPVNNKQTFRQKMQHFIDSNGLLIGMSVITIYALFGDDIRLCGFTKEDDDVFFALATVCFFFFSAEFVLCCIFKDNFL